MAPAAVTVFAVAGAEQGPGRRPCWPSNDTDGQVEIYWYGRSTPHGHCESWTNFQTLIMSLLFCFVLLSFFFLLAQSGEYIGERLFTLHAVNRVHETQEMI